MNMSDKERRLYVPLEANGGDPQGALSARLAPGADRWQVEIRASGQNTFRTEVIDLPEMQKDPWSVVKVALTRRGRRP